MLFKILFSLDHIMAERFLITFHMKNIAKCTHVQSEENIFKWNFI